VLGGTPSQLHGKIAVCDSVDYPASAKDPVSHPKQDDTFKVIDRRLFSESGELRQEVVEEERRRDEAQKKAQPAPAGTATAPAAAPREAPKPSLAFKTLITFLAQNAEMILRGIPDPRTGRSMLDLESLRQVIEMLEALREKSEGNRTEEESQILSDLIGDLKYTFVQVQAQAATPAMKAPMNPTSRKP
jgi:3-oxoacyl-ACP reductase-like protein